MLNAPPGIDSVGEAVLLSRGHLEERDRIVAWLRDRKQRGLRPEQVATMLERGQHRSGT